MNYFRSKNRKQLKFSKPVDKNFHSASDTSETNSNLLISVIDINIHNPHTGLTINDSLENCIWNSLSQ